MLNENDHTDIVITRKTDRYKDGQVLLLLARMLMAVACSTIEHATIHTLRKQRIHNKQVNKEKQTMVSLPQASIRVLHQSSNVVFLLCDIFIL